MIKLRWLKIKAFRSFQEETIFVFPTDGLVLINGVNLNTQDSSGTGKSSIFYALAYLLDILPTGMAAKDLQCLYTEEKMEASASFSTPQGDLLISKGKTVYCNWNKQEAHNAKLVNELVAKAFGGVDSEILSTMVFRPQASSGLFLNKTDTEKREFLTKVLQINKFEAAVDKAKNAISVLEQKIVGLNEKKVLYNKILDQLGADSVSSMVPAYKKQIEDINDLISNYEAELIDNQQDIKAKESERPGEMLRIKEEYALARRGLQIDSLAFALKEKNKMDAIQVFNHGIKIETNTLRKEVEELNMIMDHIQGLEIQIEHIQTKKSCPTCLNTSVKEPPEHLFLTLEKLKQDYGSGTGPILNKIEELNATYQTYKDPPEKEDFKQRIIDLNKKETEELLAISEKYSKLVSENLIKSQDLKTKIESLSSNRALLFSKLEQEAKLVVKMATIQKDLTLVEEEWTLLNSQLDTETMFVDNVGKAGFLGYIFDEILVEIVSEINSMLSKLANMVGVRFDFQTEKTTGSGDTKKAIVPVVHIYGHESKLANLSGGMLSSLNLITDLSVKRVLERRTGLQIGFQFIDEAFNGQGQNTKEAALEILKENSQDKAFFVIDHDCQFKELFDNVIEVEMSNGVSKKK